LTKKNPLRIDRGGLFYEGDAKVKSRHDVLKTPGTPVSQDFRSTEVARFRSNLTDKMAGALAVERSCFVPSPKEKSRVEIKGGVDDARSFFDLVFFDRDRNLNLGGGDHANIDVGLPEGGEHLSGNAGVAAHSDANAGKLRDTSLGLDR